MTEPIKFAVYVIAVEDTEEDLQRVLDSTGVQSWNTVARAVTSERADAVVDALAEYNLDVEALLGE
jgi:hypothetical protein